MQFEDKPLTFRFKIRELREKYGYTQKKMSELLGIERSTYTYYETGKTEPSLRVLRKMAVVFHVSTDYLVDMSDTKNSIEEKIYELQNKKSMLIDNVLSTKMSFINKLSKEDIMSLFE